MAPYHHPLQQQQQQQQQQQPQPQPPDDYPKYLVDTLYCSEEQQWEEEDEDDVTEGNECNITRRRVKASFPPPILVLEQEMLWDEEELKWLLSKEQRNPLSEGEVAGGRREAVEWMMRVKAHYSFSALTAVLAVNYLDRFLSSFFCFQDGGNQKKPWMTQLVAVACLSLAAKVEETYVPLLLHLQVEETRYVFEAKTIKRMEILVLSTLGWKMNPPTPLSFLDYIVRRLALKPHLCFEFLRRCESLLLSLIPDSRFISYLPSVLATAAVMRVINSVEPRLGLQYQNQLLAILGINKDKVDECSKLMWEVMQQGKNKKQCSNKRKFESVPGSPNGVMDVSFSSASHSSNDSCSSSTSTSTSTSTSVSSSPEPLSKKNKTNHEHLLLNLPNSDHFITIPR